MAVNFTDTQQVFTEGLVGVVSTKTSPYVDVSKRESINIVFWSGAISSGNGVFTVDASNDNSYWATGIAIQSAAMVGVSATPGVKSVTLPKNGSWAGIINPVGWNYIRVRVVRTTDGRYGAILHSQG